MIIFAHRGASGYAPENSKASFLKAIQQGAKAFEFDVQITLDEEYVVFHDYTLERTSNGLGKLSENSLLQLKKLDIGSWFNEKFLNERILTLSETIELLPKDSFLNIELKRDKRDTRFFDEKLIEILKPIKERVLISSFDWELLKRLNSLEKNINFGILIDKYYHKFYDDINVLPFVPYSINPNYRLVNKDFMDIFSNFKIIAYTVNDLKTINALEKLGIYGVFCNYPDIKTKE